MRYLMMSKNTDSTPDEKLYAEMGKFIEELSAAGILLATGGLAPGGIRMTAVGDEITVTDGPFAEAKEAFGGFALIEVRSEEEMLELGRRFLRIVGDGESIIHQVFA
ncbi:YciI family protein [Longispora sp. K20-0274]|uniref:YciI family protein n=1 Tax=Longispora sp. K20-0274 TaxID=3088255 RepID=UPI003999BE65